MHRGSLSIDRGINAIYRFIRFLLLYCNFLPTGSREEPNNSLSEIISEIAAELNLTEESVENYLVAVSTFKPKYNADFYASDDEDDFYSSAVDSVANDLDTEALYFKLLRQEAQYRACRSA